MQSTNKQTDSDGLPESFIGNVIDNRYKIEEYIASGSFGYVYAAQHQIFGHSLRKVAFKLIKEPGLTREDASESMEDALMVAELAETHADHEYLKHIVHIYDIGICESWNNRGYIIMEHVAGDLLGEINESKGLPVNRAVNYAKQICRGVSLAHEIDPPVVHRDLKPGNILITKNDIAKVADFGLAKAVGFRTGKTEGAGDFMCQAPESLEGICSTRSDVYSIGLILYEMLTGEHIFSFLYDDLNATESTEKQLEIHKKGRHHEFPDMVEKNPLLRQHPELIEIIRRCCEIDPEKRAYKDASELLKALENPGGGHGDKSDHDPIPVLLNKARAAQHNDPEIALKFIEDIIEKDKRAHKEKYDLILRDAYYLKGKILGATKPLTRGILNEAQKALFTAHKDYHHPTAASARRDLLLKSRGVK